MTRKAIAAALGTTKARVSELIREQEWDVVAMDGKAKVYGGSSCLKYLRERAEANEQEAQRIRALLEASK